MAKGAVLNGKDQDGNVRRSVASTAEESPKTPKQMGITKNLSKQAQKLAAIGVDVLPFFEAEAKERQLSTLKQNSPVPEIIPEQDKGETREKAAQAVGTNPRYLVNRAPDRGNLEGA